MNMKACPKLSRLKAGLKSSQMPYPVAVGFEFLFGKLGYRLVKFGEDSRFVVWQCPGYRYGVGNMVAE